MSDSRGERAEPDPADDAELIRIARGGSLEAVGELVARWRPFLIRRAVMIARDRDQAEDLLANAVFRLISAWRSGSGPDSNVPGYLVRSMMNARIDESRSPRSRVASLDQAQDDGVSIPGEQVEDWRAHRDIDLAAEFDLVRRAFLRLPEDQQRVLNETVVHGRRPADLVEEFSRGAPAISQLAYRSKQSLRRSVLVEHLVAGGSECRENAMRLPEAVADSPDEHVVGDRGLAHVRDCATCRANWARFARLGGALGVVPAFALAGQALGPIAPASAATGATSASPDRAGPVSSASSGSVGPTALAVPTAFVRVLARPAFAVGAAVVVVAGAVAATTGALLGANDPTAFRAGEAAPLSPVVGLAADFEVVPDVAGAAASLSIGFAVPEAPWWRIDRVRVDLPPGVDVVAVPTGWSCSVGSALDCAVPGERQTGGRVVLASKPGTRVVGEFAVTIDAETAGGVGIHGDASGSFG